MRFQFVLVRVHSWFLIFCCILLTACGGAPKVQTTFLRSVDLVDMTDKMAQAFSQDSAISARQRTDSPWIISMYRVVNHTNQIIPDREKWLYLARLRALLAETDIARQRSIIWIIPPERWPIVAEELAISQEPYGSRKNPTHLLTAEFHALTNTSGQGRSDAYLCSYQLVDLKSGSIVWEGSWEVKRAVEGRTYD